MYDNSQKKKNTQNPGVFILCVSGKRKSKGDVKNFPSDFYLTKW